MQMIVGGGQFRGPIKLQDAATADGNGTAVEITTNSTGTAYGVCLQVVISGTATVTFEATLDESNWVAIQLVNSNDGTESTTTTASGLFRQIIWGYKQFRARISGASSATVTVTASFIS